jgi:hypothetical protein
MKIKIGEREYEAPFQYDESDCCISEGDERLIFVYMQDKDENRHALGAFIASALNNREEKEAAILKEREEIIAMLTDGSYCRASEHKRNICVCPEFRADIRARSIPE